jgi:hypothetical protein
MRCGWKGWFEVFYIVRSRAIIWIETHVETLVSHPSLYGPNIPSSKQNQGPIIERIKIRYDVVLGRVHCDSTRLQTAQ